MDASRSREDAVAKVEQKVAEIQGSIHNLLAKLELHEKVEWPSLLESYSILAAQIKALLNQLRTEPSASDADKLLFRTLSLLPVKLSLDFDPELQKQTEGRLGYFSHVEAPNYLRTMPDVHGVAKEQELIEKASKISSVDQASKHVASLNKAISTYEQALESLIREDDNNARAPMGQATYSNDDTKRLISAVLYGEGLMQPHPTMVPRGPMSMGGPPRFGGPRMQARPGFPMGAMVRLNFAVSCSSNMNRSMEAHSFLAGKGFTVASFGSGNQVKLPGPSADKPNVYDFGTTYQEIYKDLVAKDKHLYTQNGILHMLDRNRRIKDMPERFQDCEAQFDVIICLEERVYDQIVEDFSGREDGDGSSVHVINMDIQDNHEEATIGAFFVCELCNRLEACSDLDNEVDEVLTEFEERMDRNVLHTVCFY